MNKKITLAVFACAAILSLIGFVHLWGCVNPRLFGAEWHILARKHFVTCVAGAFLFWGIVRLGWERLMKCAPYVFLTWLVVWQVGMCVGTFEDGSIWLKVGDIRFCPSSFFPISFSLFAGWLVRKKWVKPWIVMVLTVVALLAFGIRFRWNLIHDTALRHMLYEQLCAINSASWLGASWIDKNWNYLLHFDSLSVLASLALSFGKIVLGIIAILFGGMAFGLLWQRGAAAEPERKVTATLVFMGVLGSFVFNWLSSVRLFPLTLLLVPFVSYGTAVTIGSWIGLGFAAAAGGDVNHVRRRNWCMPTFVCVALVVGMLVNLAHQRDGSLTMLVHQFERVTEPKAGEFVDCRGKKLPTSYGFKLEQQYQDMVWGNSVTNLHILDAWGRLARRSPGIEPTDGCDVRLTVDADLQLKVQDVLTKYADTNDTGRSWAVVMDANTGAIRALADTGDEKGFGTWFIYEPGSIMKPITAAIALNRGIASIDTKISTTRNDERYYRLPGDGSHVWPETLSVGDALVKSSNIVLGKLSYDVGPERLYTGLKDFGFGVKPGSGYRFEGAGVLPDWKRWDKAAWSRVGIGQFVAVTALQMARAYAILANGGMDVQPHVIEKIVAKNGEVKYEHKQREPRRVVSANVAKTVCAVLERVATSEGTARRAAVEGVRVAGKTGTAQRVVDKKYAEGLFRASFAGFFPANEPKYVIVSTFETKKSEGLSMHQGGQRPALTFAEIVKEIECGRK